MKNKIIELIKKFHQNINKHNVYRGGLKMRQEIF